MFNYFNNSLSILKTLSMDFCLKAHLKGKSTTSTSTDNGESDIIEMTHFTTQALQMFAMHKH